jgi:hypothetical protein
MDHSVYNELPDDPEAAFLYLVDLYWTDLVKEEEQWGGHDGPPNSVYIDFMSQVIAAKYELEITEALSNWETPHPGDFSHDTYLAFRMDLLTFQTKLKIRHGRRSKRFSVRLDTTTKRRIHHFINKIREIVDASDLPDRKKDALRNRLASLVGEVDRDRTRMEAVGDAFVYFSGVIGESAKQLEPVRPLIHSIAGLIHGDKVQVESEPQKLPPPPKQITVSKPQQSRSLADEIPF